MTATPRQPRRPATGDLLRDIDLQARLGLGTTTFYARKKRGDFRMFLTTRPIGTYRYARVLVDRFLAGQSTVQLGRRSA